MDASVLDRARWWSWRRQRLDRTARGVEDCLRSVVGVYSSNPQGPLSLLARVPRLMKGAAVEGVISTKRAVRIPAMRRSIYLVPTLTADQVFSATRLPESAHQGVMRRGGLTDKRYENLKAKVIDIARTPMTVDQIRAALPRPPRILTEVLQYMCAQGVLLRIKSSSIRTNDLTYAATDAWLGRPLRLLDQYGAAAWLAGEYLSGYGPVTVEDFAWWTGIPAARAAEALRSHDPVDLGGGLLLHRRDERAFAGMAPLTGRVNLLPKWDAYTMGYAEESRARFVDAGLRARVYDPGGNAQSMVLVEGRVQGTWSLRMSKTRARIALEMFDRPGPKLRERAIEEARMVATFFELDDAEITIDKVAKRAAARRAPTRRAPTRRAPTKRAATKRAGTKRAGTPRRIVRNQGR